MLILILAAFLGASYFADANWFNTYPHHYDFNQFRDFPVLYDEMPFAVQNTQNVPVVLVLKSPQQLTVNQQKSNSIKRRSDDEVFMEEDKDVAKATLNRNYGLNFNLPVQMESVTSETNQQPTENDNNFQMPANAVRGMQKVRWNSVNSHRFPNPPSFVPRFSPLTQTNPSEDSDSATEGNMSVHYENALKSLTNNLTELGHSGKFNINYNEKDENDGSTQDYMKGKFYEGNLVADQEASEVESFPSRETNTEKLESNSTIEATQESLMDDLEDMRSQSEGPIEELEPPSIPRTKVEEAPQVYFDDSAAQKGFQPTKPPSTGGWKPIKGKIHKKPKPEPKKPHEINVPIEPNYLPNPYYGVFKPRRFYYPQGHYPNHYSNPYSPPYNSYESDTTSYYPNNGMMSGMYVGMGETMHADANRPDHVDPNTTFADPPKDNELDGGEKTTHLSVEEKVPQSDEPSLHEKHHTYHGQYRNPQHCCEILYGHPDPFGIALPLALHQSKAHHHKFHHHHHHHPHHPHKESSKEYGKHRLVCHRVGHYPPWFQGRPHKKLTFLRRPPLFG